MSVGEVNIMEETNASMTEKERRAIVMATIYDVRRAVTKSGKDFFTREEFCDFLDTIADAKEQE